MTHANVDDRSHLGWTERLYQSVPLNPVWVGLAIAGSFLALFLAIAAAFGGLATFRAQEAGLWEFREVRVAVLVALLAGYLPTARRYVSVGARKNLEGLRPLLDASPGGFDAIRRRLAALDPRAARLAGALGLGIAPLTALLVDRDPLLYIRAGYWGAENLFAWVVGAFVGWHFGRFLYDTLGTAHRFSDLAGQLDRIDLLDRRGLAPFARQGLRSALLWLVLISLVSLNAADLTWFLAAALVGLVVGTSALLLPVNGIHVRLRQAKWIELERIHAAIHGSPDALSGSTVGARAASLSLSDLLAYQRFVESVREWPFDTPTMLRFALYLAIPLGSWLGGALVERLLALALE